ncbi:MAG: hypothetical protein JW807_11380 [Spirochaetes bacterium]|nr:hypothetical protein [Spirochaetota bacterium]
MTLEEAINNNKKIKILAYSVSEYVEQRMKEVLTLIFRKYNNPSMVPPVYTCMKELLVNAVKANFKNIYFEGYSSKNRSESIIDYDIALRLFKLELDRENAGYLEGLARRFEMKAEVLIHADDRALTIHVTNPVEMTEREKINVQYKIECASRFNDISEYFEATDGETDEDGEEGAGLGIILISMMLRSMGACGADFTIVSADNKTIASLRIPLS